MGFDRELSCIALNKFKDMNHALEFLLSHEVCAHSCVLSNNILIGFDAAGYSPSYLRAAGNRYWFDTAGYSLGYLRAAG